jgi:hypothetical protein
MCLDILFVHSWPIDLDIGGEQGFGVVVVEDWRSIICV